MAVTLKTEPGHPVRSGGGVKLQGRWSVVLLHSPKVNSQQQQQHNSALCLSTQEEGRGGGGGHPNTILLSGEDTRRRSPMRGGREWPRQDTVSSSGRQSLDMRRVWVDWRWKRKWHFSQFSETIFFATVWQYIWKRKANAYNTPLSKSTDAIFFFSFIDKFKILACTTLLTLDLQFLTYLPQDSVQKVFFFF